MGLLQWGCCACGFQCPVDLNHVFWYRGRGTFLCDSRIVSVCGTYDVVTNEYVSFTYSIDRSPSGALMIYHGRSAHSAISGPLYKNGVVAIVCHRLQF